MTTRFARTVAAAITPEARRRQRSPAGTITAARHLLELAPKPDENKASMGKPSM